MTEKENDLNEKEYKSDYIKVTVTMHPNMLKNIKKLAIYENKSTSHIIREAISELLSKENSKNLRKIAKCMAEMVEGKLEDIEAWKEAVEYYNENMFT